MFVYCCSVNAKSTRGPSLGRACQMLSLDILNDKIFFRPLTPTISCYLVLNVPLLGLTPSRQLSFLDFAEVALPGPLRDFH